MIGVEGERAGPFGAVGSEAEVSSAHQRVPILIPLLSRLEQVRDFLSSIVLAVDAEPRLHRVVRSALRELAKHLTLARIGPSHSRCRSCNISLDAESLLGADACCQLLRCEVRDGLELLLSPV